MKMELLASVGRVLRTEGYRGLKPQRVLQEAGYRGQRGLIKELFGHFDDLLLAYVHHSDFWANLQDAVGQPPEAMDADSLKRYVIHVLKAQLDFFRQSIEMQELLLFGLSKLRNSLKKVFSEAREWYGAPLLAEVERTFARSPLPVRHTLAFIVYATYILVLHARLNSSTVCGIDLRTDAGWKEIERGMRWLVERLAEAAGDA